MDGHKLPPDSTVVILTVLRVRGTACKNVVTPVVVMFAVCFYS